MNRLLATSIALATILATSSIAMAEKQTLVVGVAPADIGKLDPHLASAGADKGMLNWIFNALVRIKPGQANPEFFEPDLAESWNSSEDGTEWIFNIRKNVQCHQGIGEFTAEDAAYSLNRSMDKSRSAFSGDFAAIEKVDAIDKYTLKITLKQRITSLLGLVSNYHGGLMVCKKAAEQADVFPTRPIGTGPFMFAEYQPQQFVGLVANKQYFRGEPRIKEIIYRFIPSDATRDLAFRTGEIDMEFGRQAEAWVDRMREISGTKVIAMEPGELNMLHLNITQKPLDDLRVRQAINYAVDRKAFVEYLGKDVARPPVSVIPTGNLGIVDVHLPDRDVQKSKQLLAEAGYPNGITVRSIASALPSLRGIAETVQAQLHDAGINLDLDVVDHPTYMAQIRKDLSPVTLYQAARFPVADVYLSQFFYSKSTVGTPTGMTNFSHCTVADAEIEQARQQANSEKQKLLWQAAQEKIAKDVCGVPLGESLVMWAWRDTLDLGYDMVGSLNLTPHLTEKAHFTQ